MEAVHKEEFVVLDVETTGLSPSSGDRIVEIAALRIKDLKVVEEFHSFIDPGREISYGAYLVNGITPQMLRGAPTSHGILPKILDFIGTAHVIGHNIKFDLGFLCHELSLCGLQFSESSNAIDTVRMARKLMPHLGRYPLWYVARSLGIDDEQEHRALADVQMTFRVFRKLIEVAERQDFLDLKSFLQKIPR